MSTFYLNNTALQPPFQSMLDDNNRTVYTFNVISLTRGLPEDHELEIASVLVDAGLGVALPTDRTIFVGRKAKIPNDTGPYIQLIDTGGPAPQISHNEDVLSRLTLQVNVRGKSTSASKTHVDASFLALYNIRNTELTATPTA